MTVDAAVIGGLVLAGGRGSRMGGVDKGLLAWNGTTLAGHAVARLAPQVARVAVSANRHLAEHARLGVHVVRDAGPADGEPPFDGPLAGVLAAFDACDALRDMQWLAVVPCDVPGFPVDLVPRLAEACGDESGLAAYAVSPAAEPSGAPQEQPLCCLVSRSLRDALAGYLAEGRRSARGFLASAGAAAVAFGRPGDDPGAFVNANTASTLAGIDASPRPPSPAADLCP